MMRVIKPFAVFFMVLLFLVLSTLVINGREIPSLAQEVQKLNESNQINLVAEKEENDKYIVLDVEGQGKDRSSAIEQAWLEGIRQAVGSYVDSRTELKDEQLTERVISYSRGLVEKYEVTSVDDSKADRGLYHVKMRVWILKTLLQDSMKHVATNSVEIAFSMNDLKPRENLMAKELESKNSEEETRRKQGFDGSELLSATLDRFKAEDFLSYRIAGKVAAVEGASDGSFQIPLEIEFNNKFYTQVFLPELQQVLNQVASQKKETFLVKYKDELRRISKREYLPLADSSIFLRGAELGKNYSLAVYDKPDRFGCTLYAFPEGLSDAILNNETGILAVFLDRIMCVRGFLLELLDEQGEQLYAVQHGVILPFLLSESLLRDGIWAFHPTIMQYAAFYAYLPLYMENSRITIPMHFEIPQELLPLVKNIKVTLQFDDDFAEASKQTRQACRKSSKNPFLAESQKEAKQHLESAAGKNYPLAEIALLAMTAGDILDQRGDLLPEEVLGRLAPGVENGDACSAYCSFLTLEGGNFDSQKKAVPYLIKAAENGYAHASVRLGEIFDQGFYGVKPDKEKAAQYFNWGLWLLTLLADQGSPYAAGHLGRVYLEGLGVKQDTAKAEKYYTFADSKGFDSAEFWFWRTYGVAMRQVAMPEEMVKKFKERTYVRETGLWPETVESFSRGASTDPRTCAYLLREKRHVIATGRNWPLVNVTLNDFCETFRYHNAIKHKDLRLPSLFFYGPLNEKGHAEWGPVTGFIDPKETPQ